MPTSATLADPTDHGNRPGDGPLRPGGQGAPVQKRDQDLPSTLSPRAERQRPALVLVRDLMEGQARLHAEAAHYLPRATGEHPDDYRTRVQRSAFFNVFAHNVEALTGFVFRKDPVLGEDVPTLIAGGDNDTEGHWENIDNAGTHGDVFCSELLQDALIAGHAGILVDFPSTDGTLTAGAEASLGIRPYWAHVRKDDILSWRTTLERGRTILTQLVIRETTYEPDGEFGEGIVTRYRVLRRDPRAQVPVTWQLLEVTKAREVREHSSGEYRNQVEIPFAEITTSGHRGTLDSDPPLLSMAYLNVAHYQQWSDYATAIYKTNVPIFFGKQLRKAGGKDDGPVLLGPNSAILADSADAEAMYISHDGAALDSSKKALDDLKAEMGTLGVSMLATQKRAAETEEAKRIDKSVRDSALGVTARGLQDAMERALHFHARYLRLDTGGSVQVNRDFDQLLMPPDVMRAYVLAAKEANFPVRQLLEEWQAGGRIADTADLDELEMRMLGTVAAASDLMDGDL